MKEGVNWICPSSNLLSVSFWSCYRFPYTRVAKVRCEEVCKTPCDKWENLSSLCTPGQPGWSGEILLRMPALPQLCSCLFGSRKLPGIPPACWVPVLGSAIVLHAAWETIELFSASVSTVKMGITNPESKQGCELTEYQLLWDCHIKCAKQSGCSL